MQRAYIDLTSVPHNVFSATSGNMPPSLSGVLGTELDIGFGFMRSSVQEAVAAGTTGGKFTLKKKGDYTGLALLLDVAWEVIGSGAASVYQFKGSLDSDELVAAIGDEEKIELVGAVEWLLDGAAAPSKTRDIAFTLYNSTSRPEDTIPATTEARWAWLKTAAPEANGFTHDDETKEISVAESDGAALAALNEHIADEANPHAVTREQVGLGNCDNTSDANKPVSTAQQTALDLKAPLASPALTGNPTAPTQTPGNNTTRLATTAFVKAAVDSLIAAAPGALDTLNELAASLGDDADFAGTVTTALAGKEPAQTPASQGEMEAGTEAALRSMSPLRIAQAIAALGGGGGGTAIAINTAAWIETTANGGNDGTGAIGDPAHPYETMSVAYDAGARTFYLGAGTHAGLSKSGAISVHLLGLGRGVTTVTIIESNNSGAVTVRDLGLHTLTVITVGRAGANSAEGEAGTASSNITLTNLVVTTISHNGGEGGPSAVDVNNAGTGGSSGTCTLTRCEVGTLYHNGGNGGAGAGDGDNGGPGGSAGTLIIDGGVVNSVSGTGGNGGMGGASTGIGGDGGPGAAATLTFTRVTTDLNVSGGSQSSGGGGDGTAGSCGTLEARHCSINTLYMDDGSAAGTVDGVFVEAVTVATGTPVINALISRINGVTY